MLLGARMASLSTESPLSLRAKPQQESKGERETARMRALRGNTKETQRNACNVWQMRPTFRDVDHLNNQQKHHFCSKGRNHVIDHFGAPGPVGDTPITVLITISIINAQS